MDPWFWSIPLISIFSFWATAVILRNAALKKVPSMVDQLVSAGPELIKAGDPSGLAQVTPYIETQIDHFLRNKLSKSMPMISMFIGDKTINQMKSVFMQELEEIFPTVMEKYSTNLMASAGTKLTPAIAAVLKKELRLLPVAGIFAGLITGTLQMLVLTIII